MVYVSDGFVRLQAMLYKGYLGVVTVKPWHYDDKIIDWGSGYEKRKVQKSNIKEKILRVE